VNQILSLIGQYGYLVVFFGVMLESSGVPLPGETILIASGVLAEQGYLGLGNVIVFGILAAVIGDQIGYWVGRKGGRPFVVRWGRYALITPKRLSHAEWFSSGMEARQFSWPASLPVFGSSGHSWPV
jgi:membrane protein DedA with SNARE-associated domain